MFTDNDGIIGNKTKQSRRWNTGQGGFIMHGNTAIISFIELIAFNISDGDQKSAYEVKTSIQDLNNK